MIKTIQCRLCQKKAEFIFHKKILGKLDVEYFHCASCRSLQTEEPYWLEEAYQSINEQFDTGQFIRSLINAAFVGAIHSHLNLGNNHIVDYGCGSGLTARIMRDIGINAFGYDAYSSPRLLMGFKKNGLEKASLINLCEVVEHFPNPKASFEHIFSCNPDVIVIQTELFDGQNEEWAYLAQEHGQHVFFYSIDSMSYIADLYEMNLVCINGFMVLFKDGLASNFFTRGTTNLRGDLLEKINNSIPTLLNNILRCGYQHAASDNELLVKSLRIN